MRGPWLGWVSGGVLAVGLFGPGVAWGKETPKEPAAVAPKEPARVMLADFSEIEELARTDSAFAMQVYRLAGGQYVNHNQPARAVAMYTHALTLAPAEASVMQELANAQLTAGQSDAALATWERIMALRGDDVGMRMRYANFLDRAGKLEQAIAAMRALAAQRPNETTFRYWIVDAYFREGKMTEAAGELQAMLQAFPKEGSEIHRRLALVPPAPAQQTKPAQEMKPAAEAKPAAAVSSMPVARKPGKPVR